MCSVSEKMQELSSIVVFKLKRDSEWSFLNADDIRF